ncbi:MAG: amidase, partial [Bryobacteraceae bacterium]
AAAAGLVTFALGSETSGSIVTPSAFCGVTGLRPTYGMVSRRGAIALSWTLDKIGPICRSAEDCGLVLQSIAGGDLQDPGSAGKSFHYSPKYARKSADLRVGYAPVDFEEWSEPSARPAVAEALRVVKSLGFQMKEVEIPDFPYGALVETVIDGEMGSEFEDFIRGGRVDQLADKHQIAGMKASLDLPATEYLKAMRIRSLVQNAFRELMVDVDLLFTPSRLGPATKINQPVGVAPRNEPRPKSRGLNGIIPAGNLAGLPAISIPCGFADNLPLGLSFVARPWNENDLIGAARAFQSQTNWHNQHQIV